MIFSTTKQLVNILDLVWTETLCNFLSAIAFPIISRQAQTSSEVLVLNSYLCSWKHIFSQSPEPYAIKLSMEGKLTEIETLGYMWSCEIL